MSYLFGLVTTGSLSRHENAKRLPMLPAIIAYEIILGVSAGELYEGLSVGIQNDIKRRARSLIAVLERRPRSKSRDHKIAFLIKLTGGAFPNGGSNASQV